MKTRLDASEESWSMQTYHHANTEYISGTLGAHAERVRAGTKSPARRDTCAYIYHVQSGSGRSEITKANGDVKTVEWEKNDTFAVPAWSSIVHFAAEGTEAYFFVLSDRPLLDNLEMYAKDQSV
jgi:gentisate 1,2-dioxygenase